MHAPALPLAENGLRKRWREGVDYLGASSRRHTNGLHAGEGRQPLSQARHGEDLFSSNARPEALQTSQQPIQALGSQVVSSCCRPKKRSWRGFEADGEIEPKTRRIRESDMVKELEHPALFPPVETGSSEPSNSLQLVPVPSVSHHVALPAVVPRLSGHLWREAMARAPPYHSMALVPWSPFPVTPALEQGKSCRAATDEAASEENRVLDALFPRRHDSIVCDESSVVGATEFAGSRQSFRPTRCGEVQEMDED